MKSGFGCAIGRDREWARVGQHSAFGDGRAAGATVHPPLLMREKGGDCLTQMEASEGVAAWR